MTVLELNDLRDGYLRVVREILDSGEERSPRGMRTLELSPATLVITDPSKVVPVGVGRKLNFAIGAAESAHLVGGVSDAAQMVSITKNFAQFVEGGRLRGAYGPRTAGQFDRVVSCMARDRDTRQASVVVWRPWDLARPSKDVPCTVGLHFALRGGRLDMHVTMRSNDVFLGLPYDAWMFANAQHAVAAALGVEVGVYYHTAVSLHAYERDFSALEALHPWDGEPGPPMLVQGPGWDAIPDLGWGVAACFARLAVGLDLTKCERDWFTGLPAGLPASVEWYASALRPHWTGGLLCAVCRYVLPRTTEHFHPGQLASAAAEVLCNACAPTYRDVSVPISSCSCPGIGEGEV
jgi:thymidylate synthase